MIKIRNIKYRPKRIYSPWKKKILLFLLGGFFVGATGSPGRITRFFASVPKEFKKIDKEYLRQLMTEFYRDKLVDIVDVSDEETRIILTEQGKARAMQFKIDEIEIKKPKKWDGYWRLVIFDIPEKKRKARDALRNKLKNLGFYELQKSALIHPYECKDEVDFIIELFQIRSCVRLALLKSITNESELKQHFDLL